MTALLRLGLCVERSVRLEDLSVCLSVRLAYCSKLFHVRPVTQGDVYRAETEEIPRIFQVGGAFLFHLDAHAYVHPRCLHGCYSDPLLGSDASWFTLKEAFNPKGLFLTNERGQYLTQE